MATARLLAALLLFLSMLASAEMQAADFADCAGVVLDENSVPVGAAQVKFENSSGQVLRAETDGAGRFILRRFPAGDYKVEVRKAGFFLLTGQSFTVRPGTNELTLTLNHAQELHEEVQVTAPSTQIDTQDTAQRSTLYARGIRDIPVPNSHALAESLVALPEIVRDHRNNLHIAGARSGDTQYLLDGFEIGDPVSGALTSRFNIDATRAAEVQTARVGANYAHSGAGILSLETPDEWAGDNLFRLQYNLSPKHILRASFLYNRAYDSNLGLDALDPQSTTVTADQRRAFVSLKDQVWLHDTLFEFGVAADSGVLDYTPQGTQPFVLLINGTSGNYFQRLHQRGRRLQAVASVTAASRHWHGTHQLSAGLNVAALVLSQSAQRTETQALRADGTLVRQSTFGGLANPRLSNTQAGAYAQDTWSISKRFVFQAGLRTDWDRFTQSAMAEPRASVNVLPFGDDSAKLSLGWGIYNAPFNLSLIGQVFDQRQLDSFYDSTGTVVVLGPVTSQFMLPAAGLQQPRFTISGAGWQQKLAHNTLVDLELQARNGYHGFAFIDQQPAQPGGIFLLQDHRKDRYRSATISARHVFSENAELFAAYTRSLARSNEVLNVALGSIFYAPQQPGLVAWDAPNRLLTWGWTPTHIWGIQLSYLFEHHTGYPFSVVNLQQQLVGAPNSSRFPAYVSLNLGIEKKFAFRGYLWAARVEMVNAFDRENPNTVVNNIDAPNFGTFAGGQGRAFTLRVRFAGRK